MAIIYAVVARRAGELGLWIPQLSWAETDCGPILGY